VVEFRLVIRRLCVQFTDTECNAVAPLGQDRSPASTAPVRSNFRHWYAANCRRQNYEKKILDTSHTIF